MLTQHVLPIAQTGGGYNRWKSCSYTCWVSNARVNVFNHATTLRVRKWIFCKYTFGASMYEKKHRTPVTEMLKVGKVVNGHFPSTRCQLHKQMGDTIDGKVVILHVGSAMRA